MLVILHIPLTPSVNLQIIGIPLDCQEQQPDRHPSVHAFEDAGCAEDSVGEEDNWKV